jgi:hypothetical protein
VIYSVENNLKLVSKIAEKCEKCTLRDRIQYMPKALSRLGQLEEAEQQMQTVLALITSIVTGKTWENTERIVAQLEEQKHGLTQVFTRIDKASTQIDNAICQVETLHGPLADLALDDKVDDLLRPRFDQLDDSVAHLQGDMKTLLRDELPKIHCLLECNQNALARLAVPVEPALHDIWVCDFSSVPARPPYLVETQYIRNLKTAFWMK